MDFGAAIQANGYAATLADWRLRWLQGARPEQLPPRRNEAWSAWLMLCGRGWGKTRVGAEDVGYYAAIHPGVRCAVAAPTQHDCRSVCFEGKSGLLNVIPPALIRSYNRTFLEITLKNGSFIGGLSAEKPDRARGPQWHRAWLDELASWQRLDEMWSNLQFSLRLGDDPKMIITTTPRPLAFLRTLARDPEVVTVVRSTYDNAANLAPTALQLLKKTYEGTDRGQQELHGRILDEIAGALWRRATIDKHRRPEPLAKLRRIAVSVDPAVTSNATSDETGIIVSGVDDDQHVYVLGDFSGVYAPDEWARLVLELYERFEADVIVAEVNNGGDLLQSNIRAVAKGKRFRYVGVRARRGKYLRAEPVAALYQLGQVHHVGVLEKLEEQQVRFKGLDNEKSPDRLDALVYGVTELILGEVPNAFW